MRRLRLLAAIAALVSTTTLYAGDNQLPPVPKAPKSINAPTLAPMPAPTPAAKAEKTLDPVPAPADGQNPECRCNSCNAKKKTGPAAFLLNELIRKPFHGIEKVINCAEGQRLCREDGRLDEESQRLASESACLSEKAKTVCPNDLCAKLKLLKEEKDFSARASRNAVRRAEWDCKAARHCDEKRRLDEKHEQLYPVND
jgi:hypothetical protein